MSQSTTSTEQLTEHENIPELTESNQQGQTQPESQDLKEESPLDKVLSVVNSFARIYEWKKRKQKELGTPITVADVERIMALSPEEVDPKAHTELSPVDFELIQGWSRQGLIKLDRFKGMELYNRTHPLKKKGAHCGPYFLCLHQNVNVQTAWQMEPYGKVYLMRPNNGGKILCLPK